MTDAPRRGRPPASIDGEPRRSRNITMSDAEWRWVCDQAEADGISASEWIRRRVLRGARKEIKTLTP